MPQCGRLFLRYLPAILVLASISAATAQIDPLVQPRGTPISGLPGQPIIATSVDANAYVGHPPPDLTQPFDNT